MRKTPPGQLAALRERCSHLKALTEQTLARAREVLDRARNTAQVTRLQRLLRQRRAKT